MRYLLLILTASMLNLQAQDSLRVNKLKPIIHYSAAFIAGNLDGSIEALSYHFPAFKRTFGIHNESFWNPAISWRNKYKDNDPTKGERFLGSTTIFVCTTDGYHLLRTLHKAVSLSVILTFDPKSLSFKKVIKKALLLSTCYTAGKFLMYNLIIK